jgi:uncharacterized SAM-binding protein YcdF (DUF218 family)
MMERSARRSDPTTPKGMFSCFPRLRLARRREIWCPTLLGSFCVALLLIIPMIWWCNSGESILSLTRRLPADVLVVEGWIGRDGVRAAGQEFEQRGYRYIVPTGGLTSARWGEVRWSYADIAEQELIRSGIARDRIIVAPARETESRRTYESAKAVWRALQARGIQPKALNVFTLGPHAMRSRLVFAKVNGPQTAVGVVGWIPSDYEGVPWWRSSERAKDFVTETGGYAFEALFNSGRRSNSPNEGLAPDSTRHRRELAKDNIGRSR